MTKKGVETITAAVEEGWHKWLDLGRDGFYEAVELLPSLLSDRAVLDFLMAQAAQRDDLKKPQAERQPAAVTTVS